MRRGHVIIDHRRGGGSGITGAGRSEEDCKEQVKECKQPRDLGTDSPLELQKGVWPC